MRLIKDHATDDLMGIARAITRRYGIPGGEVANEIINRLVIAQSGDGLLFHQVSTIHTVVYDETRREHWEPHIG